MIRSSRVPDFVDSFDKACEVVQASGVRYLEANACWRSTVVVVLVRVQWHHVVA